MKKRDVPVVAVVFFAVCAFNLSAAEIAGRREAAWAEAAASAPYSPSPFARQIAEKELGFSADADDPNAFRRVFSAAMEIERALRFGATVQEARAELKRRLRLESESGDMNQNRIAAELRKAERGKARAAEVPRVYGRSNAAENAAADHGRKDSAR